MGKKEERANEREEDGRKDEEMRERAAEEREREEAKLEALSARRRGRIGKHVVPLRIADQEPLPAEAPEVHVCMEAAAETDSARKVRKEEDAVVGLARERVEIDREGRPADEREHLDEPMGRQFGHDGVRRAAPGRRDLHLDPVDRAADNREGLHRVDDEPFRDEPVEPAEDRAVPRPEHPGEVVHVDIEEAVANPERADDEEEERLVAPDRRDEAEERREVGLHEEEAFGRLAAGERELEPRRVLEGVVRPLHGRGWVMGQLGAREQPARAGR